jgi:excinuclease ABC subunit C
MAINKKTINGLPSFSGVYIFWQKNQPLYIGKAVNLKARILSHWQNAKLDLKEKLILEKSDRIETLTTQSEFQAVLLEAELIKKYQPKYNVRWRDDKNFLYIKITVKEKFPKVLVVRKEDDGKSLYFGPFSSTKVVNDLLREIRKIVPFCSQKKLGKKPCFYSKIGLCHPCPNYILSLETQSNASLPKPNHASLQKLYRSNINKIIYILRGKFDIILNSLEKELKTAIKEEKYEEGLRLRNRICLLRKLISERSFMEEESVNQELSSAIKRIECYDVSNLAGQEATASMVVFTNGFADKKEYRRFKIKTVNKPSDTEMLAEVITRRLAKKDWPLPDLIVVDGGKPQVSAISKVLKDHKVKIPLVGVAKKPDRIVLAKNGKTLFLPENSSFFNLLKHLRDESHRFAKKYHLLLRKKKIML